VFVVGFAKRIILRLKEDERSFLADIRHLLRWRNYAAIHSIINCTFRCLNLKRICQAQWLVYHQTTLHFRWTFRPAT
jgi:hypothetical protein